MQGDWADSSLLHTGYCKPQQPMAIPFLLKMSYHKEVIDLVFIYGNRACQLPVHLKEEDVLRLGAQRLPVWAAVDAAFFTL